MCGGILSNTNGNITSIGYPNANYSNNEECIWVIQNPNINGSTIMLNFMDFSLESHGDCTYDFIEVREGILFFFCVHMMNGQKVNYIQG